MCRRLQSYRRLLANGAIFCSPFLPLAHGLVLELSASVLAIIRRCLQTGRRAHTPCQWVLQTRRRQALLRRGFPEQFCHAAGRRNALRLWPAGRIVLKTGFSLKERWVGTE